MRFGEESMLWCLVPWILALPLWIVLGRRALAAFHRFVGPSVADRVVVGRSVKRARLRFALIWVSVLFAIFAAARPQLSAREETVKSEGLDLVIALDVSRSMATEDVVPSRLKKAKHIIKGFLERMSSDRVGIVAFAGTAVPIAPLTSDYDYLRQILETVDETTISNQGTDIFEALTQAKKLIERGGVGDQSAGADAPPSRAVIVLSDGEDTVGREKELGAVLKKSGIRVYSIGVGSLKGAPIPLRDDHDNLTGYKKDQGGTVVISKLASAALEAAAAAGGGRYYASSAGETEVDEILAELLTMDRTGGQSRKVLVFEEVFQYPLVVAVALALLFLILSERVAAVALVALFFTTQAQATGVQEYLETRQGVKAFEKGDLPAAAEHFGSAQGSNPESKVNDYNLGTALLKAGSVDGAIPNLERGTGDGDSLLGARSAYNLGRAWEQQQDHEKALQAYQAGVDRITELRKQGPLKPDAEETLKRLRLALETAEQKKQQQKQDGGEGKDQKQKQDQQGQNNKDQQGKDKDNKDGQGKDEKKKYEMPKDKQQFKASNISEQDAKRLMQQLKEQENQTSKRIQKQKAEMIRRESKAVQVEKDW
jgi:Ca-activated chloride channel family protein